jgi:hypothetical protein
MSACNFLNLARYYVIKEKYPRFLTFCLLLDEFELFARGDHQIPVLALTDFGLVRQQQGLWYGVVSQGRARYHPFNLRASGHL